MAARAGKDGSIRRGAVVVGYIDSWTIDSNVDLHEISALGDNDKEYVAGQQDVTAQIQGTFSSTDPTQTVWRTEMLSSSTPTTHQLRLLYNSTVGAIAGWSGNAIINAKSIGSSKDGKQSFSGTATYSGGVTAYTSA